MGMIKLNVINYTNTQNTLIGWGNNLLAYVLGALQQAILDGLSLILLGRVAQRCPPSTCRFYNPNLVVLTQLLKKLPNEA